MPGEGSYAEAPECRDVMLADRADRPNQALTTAHVKSDRQTAGMSPTLVLKMSKQEAGPVANLRW